VTTNKLPTYLTKNRCSLSCAKRACRKTSLPGDCRLLQFFEVPFDKWRDIDLYALENAYLESGWDVARTAVVLMARLRVHRVRSM
ncbi:MAG: hypothetical protein ABSF93_20080, partial [Candidatus Sulfotelmatobacter sp.]